MALTTLLLGLSLIAPAMAAPADTVKAPKRKPDVQAPAPPAPPARPAPKVERRPDPQPKPMAPVGEPKLKRRKLPV